MIELKVENILKELLDHLSLGLVYAEVENLEHNPELWEKIERESERVLTSFVLENIKNQPQIYATREAYKNLGKDPNRYRPSAEALYRRIIKGAPLYKISILVDIINLVSLRTGYSIGGFDANKIAGSVILGIGKPGEPFEAIGRGELNIENLPVYRDLMGGIGTPTSDTVRTSLDLHTTKVFLVINDFSGDSGALDNAINFLGELILKFGNGKLMHTSLIY